MTLRSLIKHESFRKYVFPILVTFIFLLLVLFRISGTSIGVYDQMMNGLDHNDPALLTGNPQSIRSDEWILTTQMAIAQDSANFPSSNPNIGEGQNMNIILDVPTKHWSQIFRPQNWAFFVMPIENAFAYKWWFTAVLLVLAVYFVVLHFLPRKYLVASLLSVGFFFSGFIQWWYIGSTLACLAYPLLIALFFMHFLERGSLRRKAFLTLCISYCLVAFAIILYPPFQIPCALVLLSFLIGYTIQRHTASKSFEVFMREHWYYIASGVLASGFVIGLFLVGNIQTLNSISTTAYPGKRVISSGHYSTAHIFSGSLAFQHQRHPQIGSYSIPKANAVNPSEASTFIFTSVFLLPPVLIVCLRYRTSPLLKRRSMALLYSLGVVGIVFFIWLFLPHFDWLGTITKLDIVPQNRLVIGLGLLNLFLLLSIMHIYTKIESVSLRLAVTYASLIFILLVFVHLRIQHAMPGFISAKLAVLLAAPVPLAVFFLLRKYYTAGIAVLSIFIIVSSGNVNPLYQGLSIVTENQLAKYIAAYPDDGAYWVAQDIYLENFALMNGKDSLSGVFTIPQLDVWEKIDDGKTSYKYNRYAHVSYNFDQNPSETIATGFVDTGPDQIVIGSEVCSAFVRDVNIRHIISSAKFMKSDQPCIDSTATVPFGNKTFYVYHLSF